MDTPLFRTEVTENISTQNYGSVFINTPLKYALISFGSLIVSFAIIAFILFAEVAEKVIVRGYVNVDKGILAVYPVKQGLIIKQYVKQGETVNKGDPLFLIDTSYDGFRTKHPAILANLEKRKHSLSHEIELKRNQVQAFKKLLQNKYLSQSAYAEKHEELVALKNNQRILETEIIRYKQTLSYILRAPSNGSVANLLLTLGAYANPSKPVVKILPAKAKFQLALCIPVQQAGFIVEGKEIRVQYDAYPYQRFGSYSAKIQTISQSMVTDKEEDKPLSIGQPYYKVMAVLDKPFVRFYGREIPLQQDMTVSAVILGSKRKIWQWILDPIYSFYGDLFA